MQSRNSSNPTQYSSFLDDYEESIDPSLLSDNLTAADFVGDALSSHYTHEDTNVFNDEIDSTLLQEAGRAWDTLKPKPTTKYLITPPLYPTQQSKIIMDAIPNDEIDSTLLQETGRAWDALKPKPTTKYVITPPLYPTQQSKIIMNTTADSSQQETNQSSTKKRARTNTKTEFWSGQKGNSVRRKDYTHAFDEQKSPANEEKSQAPKKPLTFHPYNPYKVKNPPTPRVDQLIPKTLMGTISLNPEGGERSPSPKRKKC